MSKRHRTQPGQLSLWGVYELEAQAMRWTRRGALQIVPTPPAAKQTTAEPVRLMPSFRSVASLTPTFIEPICPCQNGPSNRANGRAREAVVVEFQAVSRPSEVQNRPDLTGHNEGETSRSGQGGVDGGTGQKIKCPHDIDVGRTRLDSLAQVAP
ncbi:hypothetical protein [Lentzea sp. NPDC092896]|uniref:hypothetical protein n=1 Tax=Lentzea sp. NPDC092896 TaxID=3364127 RepID=UPI003811064F